MDNARPTYIMWALVAVLAIAVALGMYYSS
jgi:hypothetical protein